MLREILPKLMKGDHLSRAEAQAVMQQVMAGEATPVAAAAMLTALAFRGETVDEVAGFVQAMLDGAERFPTLPGMLVDTCGTGGDRSGTFNISTATAFVAAGAGLQVVKHGNRSVTSKSGSADVLEALGVAVDQPLAGAVESLEQTGITFLFAPKWHPAMKHVATVRGELGFPTVFNLLGPLANPARPRAQLLGVSRPELTGFMAQVLAALGTERALVIHGAGLDEISVCAPTSGVWLADGQLTPFQFDPTELGWERAEPAELLGGGPTENAAIVRGVLDGSIAGAKRRAVVVNAAAALMVAGQAPSIAEALPLAEAAIDTGAALGKLQALATISQRAKATLP